MTGARSYEIADRFRGSRFRIKNFCDSQGRTGGVAATGDENAAIGQNRGGVRGARNSQRRELLDLRGARSIGEHGHGERSGAAKKCN